MAFVHLMLVIGLARGVLSFVPLAGEHGLFRLRRQTPTGPQTCLNTAISPLDYLYGYTRQQCTCRSERNCSPDTNSAPTRSSGQLCSSDDEIYDDTGKRRGTLSITLTVAGCCGTEETVRGAGAANVTVEVWQANRFGTYTQRSKCFDTLKTDEEGKVSFTAPIPGPMSFGAHSRQPTIPYGPINVVVHTFRSHGSGQKIFNTASVRLFPTRHANINAIPGSGNHFLNCGPNFNISNFRNNHSCTFEIQLVCKDPSTVRAHAPDEFIKWRKNMLNFDSERNRRDPPVPGCPKLMDLQKAYKKASHVMIVEVCDQDRSSHLGVCNDSVLRTFANRHQSLYLARPLIVFKGALNVKQTILDTRMKTLAKFKRTTEDKLNKWAILLDHHLEVECCNEIEPGQQYVVMGIPLPTVRAGNANLSVVRLWAERVNNVHTALHHLLLGN